MNYKHLSKEERGCIRKYYVEGLVSVDKGKHGFDGQKCAHTSSKPLPIHKVLPAAFSLSEHISAPSKLLRT